MHKKKANTTLTVLAVLLVITTIIVGLYIGRDAGLFTATAQSDKFYVPIWGRYEFAPQETFTSPTSYSFDKDMITAVGCGGSELTDRCYINIKIGDMPWYCDGNQQKIRYEVCGAGDDFCGVNTEGQILNFYDNSEVNIGSDFISNGEKIVFFNKNLDNGVACDISGNLVIQKKYVPWHIYRYDGGRKDTIASDTNCLGTDKVLGVSMFSRIPKQESPPNCFSFDDSKKWVNYVADFVQGSEYNVYDNKYTGYEPLYCRGGVLYEIVSIEMSDGSFVELSPTDFDVNNQPSGYNLKSIGNQVDVKECCPSDAMCGDDFMFTADDSGNQCFSSSQCNNAGSPIPSSDKTYTVERCEGGVCVESDPISVECTSNNHCLSGEICDFSLTNYGVCVQQTTTNFCGDGFCNGAETVDVCPADCREQDGDDSSSFGLISLIVLLLTLLAAAFVTYKADERVTGEMHVGLRIFFDILIFTISFIITLVLISSILKLLANTLVIVLVAVVVGLIAVGSLSFLVPGSGRVKAAILSLVFLTVALIIYFVGVAIKAKLSGGLIRGLLGW